MKTTQAHGRDLHTRAAQRPMRDQSWTDVALALPVCSCQLSIPLLLRCIPFSGSSINSFLRIRVLSVTCGNGCPVFSVACIISFTST